MRTIVAAALAAALLTGARADDKEKVEELIKKIETAAKDKKYDDMIKFATEAAKLDDKNPAIPFALGSAYTAKRDNAKAVEAFKKAVELAPKSSVAYDRLGDAYFKNGQAAEAVKSFNESIDLIEADKRKDVKANHWRLGLALYYADKYKEGADQFNAATGQAREDVENSVWHYLCVIQDEKQKKNDKAREVAQKGLIAVKGDEREPMAEIWKLFKEGKPEPAALVAEVSKKKFEGDAKKAEEAKKEAEFYAYLYCALYFESEGKKTDSENYLKEAVKREISHYMWDVAKMHLKKLEDAKKP